MQSKEKNLARHLDDLCIYLESTFEINSGGCCFIASVIAHCLEQDELKFKVGVSFDDEFDPVDNFYDINCNAQSHYFIILDDCTINDDDVTDFTIYNNVSSKDLLMHYKECEWNPEYNTKNNDFIEHLIKELYVKLYETIFKRESECICL